MLFVAVAGTSDGAVAGLDPLVAQNFRAAGASMNAIAVLVDGIWLGIVVTPPMVAVIFGMNATMNLWGLPAEVLALSQPYLAIPHLESCRRSCWAVAFGGILQAMKSVRPVMFALVAANIVNALANWVLIDGHLGRSGDGRARVGLPHWRRASSWPGWLRS